MLSFTIAYNFPTRLKCYVSHWLVCFTSIFRFQPLHHYFIYFLRHFLLGYSHLNYTFDFHKVLICMYFCLHKYTQTICISHASAGYPSLISTVNETCADLLRNPWFMFHAQYHLLSGLMIFCTMYYQTLCSGIHNHSSLYRIPGKFPGVKLSWIPKFHDFSPKNFHKLLHFVYRCIEQS